MISDIDQRRSIIVGKQPLMVVQDNNTSTEFCNDGFIDLFFQGYLLKEP
jgi:hypothetical protein